MNNLNVAKIQLNGDTYEINNGTNLNQLLKKLKIQKNKVAIEVNGEISKVSLISTGSTTHAQGSESKFRNINFTKVLNNKIEIKLDNNSNNLQNGTKMENIDKKNHYSV